MRMDNATRGVQPFMAAQLGEPRLRLAAGRLCGLRTSMANSFVALSEVRRWIGDARRVVVLTGAGISTDSGIPDFRGPQGVWTRNPAAEAQSTLQNYLADAEVRKAAWRSRLAHPAWTAQPNRGHLALVELERRGKLHALITQNIDELHRIAGNSAERIVEVHGTMRRTMCWGCGERRPMQEVLQRVRAGDPDPACLACGGILKSDTISFGQALVPEVIERAMKAAAEADVFLAVGSTLQVYPVAGAVPIAREAGARVVILNNQPTPMDELADAVVREPIGEVLPALCTT
jgi:NAD-dependent deacetylase